MILFSQLKNKSLSLVLMLFVLDQAMNRLFHFSAALLQICSNRLNFLVFRFKTSRCFSPGQPARWCRWPCRSAPCPRTASTRSERRWWWWSRRRRAACRTSASASCRSSAPSSRPAGRPPPRRSLQWTLKTKRETSALLWLTQCKSSL